MDVKLVAKSWSVICYGIYKTINMNSDKKFILITGGAGYIGSHTNKLLNQLGYHTIILDNLSNGRREMVKWGTFIEGDLSDGYSLDSIFSNYQVDTVVHFAAYAYVGESVYNPDMYYKNNVVNTLNLLDAMRKYDVKKIVFSSTCATFGNPFELPVKEDHSQLPLSPYGRTKLMMEHILKDFDVAYGIKHVILRYFNASGADPDLEVGEYHQPETHLIPLVIESALYQNSPIKIFGNDYPTPDGTCIRDYIHVNDLADAHEKAISFLEKNNYSNDFNLGNGKGFSVMDVIKMVEKLAGKPVIKQFVDRRAGDPSVIVGSSEKAFKELNWKPKFNSLESIISTALNWHIARAKNEQDEIGLKCG
ncbi:MAG: UDP-glucose 4-epimerase GalE [Sphingobacteriaceae bacterium]